MAAAETLARARAGADPTSAGLGDRANVAWLLDRHGPHTSAGLARRLGLQQWRVARAVYFTLPELHEALFPTSEVALAFRLQVGLQTGISPEGVDNLTAGCVEWIGATDARISWVKARGGGRQSQVFASRGRWSPGRLVERWLAYSARVRRFASDPAPLWLYCHGATFKIRKAGFWWPVREAFAARHNLRSDDGTRLRLGFRDSASHLFRPPRPALERGAADRREPFPAGRGRPLLGADPGHRADRGHHRGGPTGRPSQGVRGGPDRLDGRRTRRAARRP